MGELTSLSRTSTIFCEVRTFPDVLLIAVKAFVAIPKDCEVTADSMARTYTDVWEWAFVASTATVVGEMHTKWCALRCRIVRELTGVGIVWAVPL
jgi:hypothetical protein